MTKFRKTVEKLCKLSKCGEMPYCKPIRYLGPCNQEKPGEKGICRQYHRIAIWLSRFYSAKWDLILELAEKGNYEALRSLEFERRD